MSRRVAWSIALSVLALALLTLVASRDGCGDRKKPDLVVLCGNSFLPPTDALIARFKAKTGVTVVTTTGGSEDLLPHVKLKAQGDIFITHDPYLDETRKVGSHSGDAQVGFVAPVLAVRKGNPKGITKIEDLAKPGLKVALSDPMYSTCGEMVASLLGKKGIKDAVMKNVGNRLTRGHGTLGTFLQTGAVDAVIMWNGVANTFKSQLEIVKTPYEYDKDIRVHVIGLNYSKKPELVRQFVEFARAEGPGIFAKHGYVK